MWKRKEIKACGKRSFTRNFWAAVAVCFILAFTGAAFSGSVGFIHAFDAENQNTEAVVQQGSASNWDIMLGWLHLDEAETASPLLLAADQNVKPLFDTATSSFSAFFSFLDRSHASGVGGVLIAILGVIGGVWFSIWVVCVLPVGAQRFFLEARVRDHISISALFTPFHRGNWWNTVKAMLLRGVYLFFWMFTVVGGVIKLYSYRMVPYILAENPHTAPRDAIRLSRRMMHGSKWRCFLLDLTFYLQWSLLPTMLAALLAAVVGLLLNQVALCVSLAGVLTGLLSILYVNGYRSATYAALYVKLRNAAIDRGEPLADRFTVPAFGEAQVTGEKPRLDDSAVQQPIDPVFHFAHRHRFDYNRHYSIKTIILLFFAFAFVGWVWEVSLHIVTEGMFINRGTMFGPWLPIYGAGGALVLVLLKKLFKSPIATFFVSMVLCSIIEYFTSWYLEYTKGVRWWDYSGYFMNLNGRICLEGAVVFGLGCCAVVYLAGPALGALIDRIAPPVQLLACAVLVALFSADAVYSHFHPNAGEGITDYDNWKKDDTAEFIVYIAPTHAAPTYTSHLL